MFPKSTHETFSTKLFKHFLSHPRLEKEKFSETDFTLSHYAGKVIQCCRLAVLSLVLKMKYFDGISSNTFM